MNEYLKPGLVAVLLASSLPLAAQETSQLEELVITAQKREQSLGDVSVSVTAFSGEAIRELNLSNSVDIAAQTPGMKIGTPVGEGNNPAITLRGVGLNDFNDNNEGPIAIYRDEVYQAAMPGLTFQLFDLDRVEILRGPQGSLYGRNATGGLVHFISARPTQEYTGYGEINFGEYSQLQMEGALSGPIMKTLTGRIAFATNSHDGYVTNRIGPDGNEAETYAFRGQFLFEPNDQLSILFSGHHGEGDTVAPKYQHQVTDPSGVDFWGYADTDDDNFAGDYDRQGILNIENYGYTINATWDGENFDLAYITGFEQVDKIHQEDTDVGPYSGIEPEFMADVETFSQEFRISGEREKMNWVAGIYYFNSDADNNLELLVNYPDGLVSFLDTLAVADGGFAGGLAASGYVAGADPSVIVPFVSYDVDYAQDTESIGIFGQVDYDLTELFTLVGGLRYTTEDRSYDYVNNFGDRNGNGAIEANNDGALTNFLNWLNTTLPPTDPDYFPTEWFLYSGAIDNDNVSGKITLEYRPNDDLLLYAGYSRGFKSGGFNGGFLDLTDGVLPTDTPYNEEILNSYEMGIKAESGGGTLRFNGAAFYYDYEDFQALTFSGLSQFINNSDAEVYGVDMDLAWVPNENWDVLLGASFLDTNVDQVVVQGTPVTDVDMVLAPDFTFNGLVRYTYPLKDASSLSFQIDFNHQGDHYFDITNSPTSEENAYTVFNARIGYRYNEHISAAVWAKNLGDEEYRVYTFDFTAPGGFNQQFFAPPQWFGGSLSYEF
ncbi:MAG: TonB-dependent receptor [Gammaproteobacteria bacterium]|nr:MAG: TonB-dependent receptor [Gammaproteobacteria bacterium]